jgi:hypothetical protein
VKSTTSINKIKSEFSLQNATHFGGFKIFLAYLEKIKLSQAMSGLSGGKDMATQILVELKEMPTDFSQQKAADFSFGGLCPVRLFWKMLDSSMRTVRLKFCTTSHEHSCRVTRTLSHYLPRKSRHFCVMG